jgi:hypothetical protein
MERATRQVEEHQAEAHHPEPVPRDPELPTVSERTLIVFAALALLATAAALFFLLG